MEQSNPRRLVAAEPIGFLVDVLADQHHPLSVLEGVDECRFVCPLCGWLDHNGGTATLLDSWRWKCWRCNHIGTRIALEQLILEDGRLLAKFYRLINDRDLAS
jgi:hypothetical protein